MGDGLARTPRYAEGQVKVLLGDLRNSSHNVKAKAIKHFQAYIEKYQPDIYDDDVDFLFMGTYDGTCGLGLLHWSGLASGNHSGQLKRICGPAIGLITFLLTTQFEGDNIFYERFILLPVQGLKLINFVKHILSLDNNNLDSKLLWILFIKKYQLELLKEEYAKLIHSKDAGMFDKAQSYLKEIAKAEFEIKEINETLTS